MKISANEIKAGHLLEIDKELMVVLKPPVHTKPGKGGAYVQLELRILKTGNKIHTRLSSSDSVEKASLEQTDCQYLYKEGDNLVLMDIQSFEQILVASETMGEKLPYLEDNMEVTLESYKDKIISIKLPNTVILEITETDPSIKGSTVTSSYKPAILSNGIKTSVPPYLSVGEKIVVKTEDNSFVERVK
jgi:elongation factor P